MPCSSYCYAGGAAVAGGAAAGAAAGAAGVQPAGQALKRKADWVKQIEKEIEEYKKLLPDKPTAIDIAIARNRFITAQYAKLYLEKPDIFTWFGLAALVSEEVGQAMIRIRDELKAAEIAKGQEAWWDGS